MALTITSAAVESPGKGRTSPMFAFGARPISAYVCEIDFDSSYPTGGETLDFTSAGQDAFRSVLAVLIESKSGYSFEYDYANTKVKAFQSGGARQSINVEDDDDAASAGVAVYVHVDEVLEQGTALAHFEFISPTNADGTGIISTGGATYYLQDDDNAGTAGVALYLDEDATIGSRLLANTGRDCYVMISNGEMIKVTHNATPGTPGVQVYFDEDAANAAQRLRFVSPTNADGTAHTSNTVSMRRAAAAEEVPDTTDLSALTDVRVIALGIK